MADKNIFSDSVSVKFVDTRLVDYSDPCGDCGEVHKSGDHVVWRAVDQSIVWQGCVRCYIRRTDPSRG